ncbi:MAG: IS1595 family transposase, partial [Chloroflexi bacterium]|nr:IS1595 family transposase [Chloroflexota bacterium]
MVKKREPISFTQVMEWTDAECRAYLEAKRWPDGPVCPKCGAKEPYTVTRKSASKNLVRSFYRCRECKRQFTATIGTIFEDSHIPLSLWFKAIYLMCASKKGVSAHQIHRELEITYKSAWFMCHRIREAMREKDLPLLSGTIEADETYVGGRQRGHPVERERVQDEIKMGLKAKDPHPRMEKAVVFGMLERDGKVRTMHVGETSSRTLRPILVGSI